MTARVLLPWAPKILVLAALLLPATSAVFGSQEPAPTPEPAQPTDAAPTVEPLLPTENVLESSTWVRLGERLLDRFIDHLPSLVAAVIVLLAFLLLARVASGLIQRVLSRTEADPALAHITSRLARYTILVIGVIMALSQAGLRVGSLLAGVGVAGLAVGLAAQDTLANLVAGITILWDRPFRTGDNVTIAGTFGQVQQVGLRTTRLLTVDQLDVILPNKQVIEDKIVNHTLNPRLRLDVPLGIAYWEDIAAARKALLEKVRGHEMVLDQPEPEVVTTELADSSVNLSLRVWLKDPKEERAALFEMLELSKYALDEAGIDIPFPQLTLHLASDSPPLTLRSPTNEIAPSNR